MAKGVGRAIRDGSCNNITEEIWVGKNLITFRQDLRDQLPNKPIWVSNLITSQKKWDNTTLKKSFEEEMSDKIRSIHTPVQIRKDDFYWLASSKADYSIKSGYWFLKDGITSKEKVQLFWKEL